MLQRHLASFPPAHSARRTRVSATTAASRRSVAPATSQRRSLPTHDRRGSLRSSAPATSQRRSPSTRSQLDPWRRVLPTLDHPLSQSHQPRRQKAPDGFSKAGRGQAGERLAGGFRSAQAGQRGARACRRRPAMWKRRGSNEVLPLAAQPLAPHAPTPSLPLPVHLPLPGSGLALPPPPGPPPQSLLHPLPLHSATRSAAPWPLCLPCL